MRLPGTQPARGFATIEYFLWGGVCLVAAVGLRATSSDEFHPDAGVLAPDYLARVLGGAEFQLEFIWHGDRIGDVKAAARVRQVAHRTVDDRPAIVENDLGGLQSAHARLVATVV